jgi:type I restriction enzyme R subunit
VFAEEVLNEVAKQMAELLKEVNKEKKSFKDLGITYEEKAFYDILKEIAHKFGFEYPEDKLLTLAAAVKKMVDDKSKYTDWANRSDIKAELQMDLILILAEHGYPPVPQDEVFKEIFEQAENFKKYEQEDDSKVGVSDMLRRLENVEDDRDVRNLIFNRLHMDASISDGELQREVIELYGERYPDMSLNDWRHIIEAYTPMVRNASDHKAKEVSMQTEQFGMAAEPSVKRDEE